MMTSEVLMLVPILVVVLFFLIIISCIFWAYYKASRELSRLRDSCLRNHVILTADTHTPAELAVFTNTMHLHTLHRQLSDEELSVEDEIDHVRIVNELTKPPSYEEPPSYEMALIIEASNQRNENFNSTE